MAEKQEVKPVVYMREFVSTAKGQQFQFYSTVDEAVQDEDPRLKMLVYTAKVSLLGEIKTVLIPFDSTADQATQVVITTGTPKPKKTLVQSKK